MPQSRCPTGLQFWHRWQRPIIWPGWSPCRRRCSRPGCRAARWVDATAGSDAQAAHPTSLTTTCLQPVWRHLAKKGAAKVGIHVGTQSALTLPTRGPSRICARATWNRAVEAPLPWRRSSGHRNIIHSSRHSRVHIHGSARGRSQLPRRAFTTHRRSRRRHHGARQEDHPQPEEVERGTPPSLWRRGGWWGATPPTVSTRSLVSTAHV